MAFPSVRSSSGGSSSNGTAPSFTLPATIAAGDLILVFAATDNTAAFTVPAGYTAISSQNGTAFQVAVFGKVASGSEGATSVSGSLASAESCCYVAFSVQGWSGNVADVEVGVIAQNQAAAPVDPSGLTVSWGADDNLFFAVAIADFWNETATGFPTGFTGNQTTQQHGDQFGGTQAISLATKPSASATEDPDGFSYSASPGRWAAFTAAIKPAGTSGPNVTLGPDEALVEVTNPVTDATSIFNQLASGTIATGDYVQHDDAANTTVNANGRFAQTAANDFQARVWDATDELFGQWVTINVSLSQAPQVAPVIGTITKDDTSASIPFTFAGDNADSFEHLADGEVTWTTVTSPITLSGLDPSTLQSGQVRATNTIGDGPSASYSFTTDAAEVIPDPPADPSWIFPEDTPSIPVTWSWGKRHPKSGARTRMFKRGGQ